MDIQFVFETAWKKRYVQMLISCGVDKSDIWTLVRSMGMIEDIIKNDVCMLTPEQAVIAHTAVKKTYPSQYESIMKRLSDYMGWRKMFGPYAEQPLLREEILNSKEMQEIKDVPLTPDDLETIITTALGDRTINIAAPCLCLAWVGCDTPEMARLKESDVDFDKHMLYGTHIPDPLWRVLQKYHETDSEIIPNRGSGRWIYKIPSEWFIKSTDNFKATTAGEIATKNITASITNMAKRYRTLTGENRNITVHLTQVAGMLYRLYEPWDAFTDEQFVESLRFKRRSYDTYQMQNWRKKFTAYCFLRETKEAT